ncbi:hypothetical protein P9112_004907 [Eukaryota sp. TZLM1-RC]
MSEQQSEAPPMEFHEIDNLLKASGVTERDDSAVMALLEYSYRYLNEIYTDAANWAHHAGRQQVTVEDIQLSTRLKSTFETRQPPKLKQLLSIASRVNSESIPAISNKPGMPKPPDKFCTTAPNYTVSVKKEENPISHAAPMPERMVSEAAEDEALPMELPHELETGSVQQQEAMEPSTTEYPDDSFLPMSMDFDFE